MFFRQLQARESSLSYFFGCGSLGNSIAVDVLDGDEEWFLEEAKKASVSINYVIDTHIHADHYSGGRKLAELAGASYCLHESNQGSVVFPFQPLKHGEILKAGNVTAEVRHTPGHTMDSICLVVRDMRRGDHPWFVITGDTLFVGSAGRPDLLGKENEMASLLYESIQNEIFSLPDETEIFPGHTAGSVCGAGLSGKPSSTVGFEKKFNQGLASGKDEFVKTLLGDIPERPFNMDEYVRVNLGKA